VLVLLLLPWHDIHPTIIRLAISLLMLQCLFFSFLSWLYSHDFLRKPSVILWLFALSFEMSRGSSQHRIHGLFERALENERLSNSVILWRLYIAYEIDIACNPSAAKRAFFRAIHACPW
jgi:uncharacterized membrane protein